MFGKLIHVFISSIIVISYAVADEPKAFPCNVKRNLHGGFCHIDLNLAKPVTRSFYYEFETCVKTKTSIILAHDHVDRDTFRKDIKRTSSKKYTTIMNCERDADQFQNEVSCVVEELAGSMADAEKISNLKPGAQLNIN